MKRRSPIALLAIAAATLTAGCTTFSDSDAAARVGDVEYTHDELVTELEELGATEEQLVVADVARGQVGRVREVVDELHAVCTELPGGREAKRPKRGLEGLGGP